MINRLCRAQIVSVSLALSSITRHSHALLVLLSVLIASITTKISALSVPLDISTLGILCWGMASVILPQIRVIPVLELQLSKQISVAPTKSARSNALNTAVLALSRVVLIVIQAIN